jgi:predicted enzyme related to lactoylglutathione lyase
MIDMKMAMFPIKGTKWNGRRTTGAEHRASSAGSVVYLNANPDLQQVADCIPKAGGKMTMPKTLRNEQSGYMAFFTDTEGNTIGLHSTNNRYIYEKTFCLTPASTASHFCTGYV